MIRHKFLATLGCAAFSAGGISPQADAQTVVYEGYNTYNAQATNLPSPNPPGTNNGFSGPWQRVPFSYPMQVSATSIPVHPWALKPMDEGNGKCLSPWSMTNGVVISGYSYWFPDLDHYRGLFRPLETEISNANYPNLWGSFLWQPRGPAAQPQCELSLFNKDATTPAQRSELILGIYSIGNSCFMQLYKENNEFKILIGEALGLNSNPAQSYLVVFNIKNSVMRIWYNPNSDLLGAPTITAQLPQGYHYNAYALGVFGRHGSTSFAPGGAADEFRLGLCQSDVMMTRSDTLAFADYGDQNGGQIQTASLMALCGIGVLAARKRAR